MKKLIAFTLAEVLIVLGIIGVVAEMTIPGLVNETNKVQFTSGLKKAYVTWNEALSTLAMDSGATGDLSGSGWFASAIDDTTFGNKIVKYFSTAEICGLTYTDCMPKNVAQYINGKYRVNFEDFGLGGFGFRTKDGMSFFITKDIDYGENCDQSYSLSGNGPMSNVCGQIIMDVNGPKAPNIMGRDIFVFYMISGQGYFLYPSGGQDDSAGAPWKTETASNCTKLNADGYGCAGRIIDEGWQMNY